MFPAVFSHRNSPNLLRSIENQDSPLHGYKSLSPVPIKFSNINNFAKSKKTLYNKISKNFSDSDSDEADEMKLKGLEEIGIFSEFTETKKIFEHNDLDTQHKQTTIHITDFMRKDQKMKLCKIAGGLQAYILKKSQYKKELIHRESTFKKFFHNRETLPINYTTQKTRKKTKVGLEKIEPIHNSHSEKILGINKIIEKCEEAMNMSFSNKGLKATYVLKK